MKNEGNIMIYNEDAPRNPEFKEFLDEMVDEYLSLIIAHVTIDALIDRMFQQTPSPALTVRLDEALLQSGYVQSEMDNIAHIAKHHTFN